MWSLFGLYLLFGLVALAGNTPQATYEYDYIVVGGGTSGLVMAHRLSEDSTKTVLVIENGPFNNGSLSSVPGNGATLNTAAMYDIYSAPVPALGNQTFLVSAGNVVGGGSYVNGMQWDRGSSADYDAWAELGNDGWDWRGLEPYFLKSNQFSPPSAETTEAFNISYDANAYGNSGPVKVSIPDYVYPDTKTMFDSWAAVDIPHPREGFADPVGVFWSPNSIDKASATRSTSRSAYYDPVASRKNLRLLTNTHVDEILFDEDSSSGGLVATGVKYTPNETKKQAQVLAAKEVILAAGAVFTPHLLMLSGIGPKNVLEAAGILAKKDMPAVGAGLQDHNVLYMNFSLTGLSPENLGAFSTNATFNQTAWEEYVQHRSGPYSAGKASGLVFLALQHFDAAFRDKVDQVRAQVATDFLPARYAADARLLAGFHAQRAILLDRFLGTASAAGETVVAALGLASTAFQKPLSRGTVTLNTTHPAAFPVVQYNTFQNPVDASILGALTRYVRAHWTGSPVLEAAYAPIVEVTPGAQYQTDEEIVAGGIATGSLRPSFAHPCGTCSMMPEGLGGCVNADLLVYGVKRLSVVDASIMPIIPAAHLQSSVYGIAEKAADIIKARG